MKHFFYFYTLLFAVFSLSTFKGNLHKSKGCDQDVAVQLIPSSAQSDVSCHTLRSRRMSCPL